MRRIRKTFVADTELAARKMGWKWLHEGKGAQPRVPGRTVTHLLDAWWAHKSPGWRTSTSDRGNEAKVQRLKDLLGTWAPADLTPGAVVSALARAKFARKKGKLVPLSSSSIQKHWTLLTGALTWGVGERWLAVNPLADTKPPPVRVKKSRAWTEQEKDAFLSSARGTRMHVLWLAALTLGARKMELLGLQWADFDGGQVHIHRQLLDDGTRGPLKTDKEDGQEKGARWIEVPPVLAAALEVHKAAPKPGCPWVFATSEGTPFNPRNESTFFKRALAKAAVHPIRFHDLRHTHASLMLEHGADPLAAADRLGHSLQVLLTTYRHVLDKRKDRAADVARSLFGVPDAT